MSTFFDTSVLMAAFLASHESHPGCIRVVAEAREPACGMHTLAEFYANTTALPPKQRLTPAEAILLVNQIAERFRILSLTAQEYQATLQQMAARGQRGGRIYDALLLACARKADAERIYTLDNSFASLAPDLADRIAIP